MTEQKKLSILKAMKSFKPTESDEKSRDLLRKRFSRTEAARIYIPEVKNLGRRQSCLADPELFLKTYFSDRYKRPFSRLHRVMIETIFERARFGGRQAIAAPRGVGKTELVKGMLLYLVLAEIVRFPLVIAATAELASRVYKDFRSKLMYNELLLDDFPEVCHPIKCLEGAPQRASKQHVDGTLTRVVWTANDYLQLPYVPGSPYGGVKMSYYGLDAAFRGVNIEGDRPDFVLIDDPETRESAMSIDQISKRESMVDQDVAGLGSLGTNIAIALLTTVQNRYCYSYRVTDPKTKPAFNGKRFALIEKWPKNLELWETYIAKRNQAQEAGDKDALAAVDFYLENRSAMDEGASLLVDEYEENEKDGRPLVLSALQAAYNKIADTSMSAFLSEYQNDPEEEDVIEGTGLTAGAVQSRLSSQLQGEIPVESLCVTVGLDIGKHSSHWTKIAWQNPAIGTVIDYGVMETYGLSFQSDQKAIEAALLAALEGWADEMLESKPLMVLIDSGAYSDAVYAACRNLGRPFFPSKGWSDDRFRLPLSRTADKVPMHHSYASRLQSDGVWLYNVNTDYWKTWVHQRFLIHSYDETGGRTAGSLALFNPGGDQKRHLSFAHHIVAEELQVITSSTSVSKPKLVLKNKNNHWLDATALACAAAGCVGIRVLSEQQETIKAKKTIIQKPISKPITNPWGRSFVAKRN